MYEALWRIQLQKVLELNRENWLTTMYASIFEKVDEASQMRQKQNYRRGTSVPINRLAHLGNELPDEADVEDERMNSDGSYWDEVHADGTL